MDFFGNQDAARRKTGILIVYFLLAIICMIGALYTVVVLACSYKNLNNPIEAIDWWRPDLLLGVAGGTISIIVLGSLYKTFELRGGGEKVAYMLGGRRLSPTTSDRDERRLLNIVEEMAIAAGMPVPPVYLLDDEQSINAFAAGYSPGDAVIGINRGTIEALNRDELQGVIAHEFSHVLNGDMRLNLRLIGILHGILLIALIGYYLMRASSGSGRRRSSNNNRGSGIQFFVIACGIWIIGYVGLFFARLIKAAVSRQREFLADASAVQFTRNPDGIAEALKKIGRPAAGSHMESPEAESASHMFFGNSQKSLVRAFATHPPLVQRIRRIDPQFDGNFTRRQKGSDRVRTRPDKEKPQPQSPGKIARQPVGTIGGTSGLLPVDPVLVMAAIGNMTTDHVTYVHDLLEALPNALKEAVHDTFSARSVVLALLLDTDASVRTQQLEIVENELGKTTCQETMKLVKIIDNQDATQRLPLVEMLKPTLQGLSPNQYQIFRTTVDKLVKADKKIDLFEFALQRVLLSRLDSYFQREKPKSVLHFALPGLLSEVSHLISALAHLGHQDEVAAQHAFEQASSTFPSKTKLQFFDRQQCSLSRVGDALDKLSGSSPKIKKQVLNAATTVVMTDGKIKLGEGELLRTIADSLDCPMPPILGNAATATQNNPQIQNA